MDAFEELRKAIVITMQTQRDPEAILKTGVCLFGACGALSRKSRSTQVSLLGRWKSNGWTREVKRASQTLVVPTATYFRELLPRLAREADWKKREAMLAKTGLALERRKSARQ